MLKNNFKLAFRSLFRQKGYSVINIAGLSISLAVTLLMLLWVQDEWSTNKFHENGDRIFYVKRTIPQEGDKLAVYPSIPYPVIAAAEKELPEVEKYMPMGFSFQENVVRGEQAFRATGSFGNMAYFESFSYPVLQGDISGLDEEVPNVAISESLAKKFFGNLWTTNAIGEAIEISDAGAFNIIAIFKDFPENSSIQLEYVQSFANHLSKNEWMKEWSNTGMQGTILLAEGADPIAVGEKLERLFKDKQEAERKEGILLQRYADDYLYGQFDEQAQVAGGRVEYVQMFGIAALLLLLISCINFVNLATARASKRAKEVGVRKTIGAGKLALIKQFMAEAFVITITSVGLAILLAETLLPNVRLITEKMLDFDYTKTTFWLSIATVIVLTTLLSGAYPSFILSAFKPINALKGKVAQSSGSVHFRKGLVIIQFVLALLLVVGAFVVKEQVTYIQNKNIGLNKDNLLIVQREEKVAAAYEVLKNELLQAEGIEKLTSAGPTPIDLQASTSGVVWEGKRADQENEEFQILWTESNFLEVFEIELASGRFYREGTQIDSNSIVLNQKAVEMMGLAEDPIGQVIQFWGQPTQIIGVVEDFNNRSLYEDIEPTAILLDPESTWSLFIKVKDGQLSEAITSVQKVFGEVVPEVPLHYEFLDKQYQQVYKSEVLTGTLANYFAFISIFIACLGLFGLSTFFAEQRTKEIGIRKVLGASLTNLVVLLSKEFLLLVSIGLVVGIPVAYYLLSNWLDNFAFNIQLEWWMFVLPIVIAVCVAATTVSIQAIRTAIINPIKSIKIE